MKIIQTMIVSRTYFKTKKQRKLQRQWKTRELKVISKGDYL